MSWFWTTLAVSIVAAISGSPAWPHIIAACAIVGAIQHAAKDICAAIREEKQP